MLSENKIHTITHNEALNGVYSLRSWERFAKFALRAKAGELARSDCKACECGTNLASAISWAKRIHCV